MSYITISSQQKHNFSLCSCFHALPTTLLLKILGGTNAWAVPPPRILGGPAPPVPPRSPPPAFPILTMIHFVLYWTPLSGGIAHTSTLFNRRTGPRIQELPVSRRAKCLT